MDMHNVPSSYCCNSLKYDKKYSLLFHLINSFFVARLYDIYDIYDILYINDYDKNKIMKLYLQNILS